MTAMHIEQIPLGQIYWPENERKTFDPAAMATLVESIRSHSVKVPILVVAEPDGRYRGLAGQRRLNASITLGLPTIPAVVHPEPANEIEAAEIRMAENIAREALSPVDVANGLARLISSGANVMDVAARVGMSQSAATKTLSLLRLSAPHQQMVQSGEISAAHGYELAKIDDPALRDELAKKCASGSLSRDALVAIRKRPKTPVKNPEHPQAGPSRATMMLDGGTVTVQGANLDIEAVIARLQDAIGKAKDARSRRLSLPTLLRSLRDTAGPQAS